MMETGINLRLKMAGCLFLCTTLLMLFVSNDSYLYDLYGKNDSTIFFMSGKAWMNGMIPYVDFSDSKGPLLWLIYGIGYLISQYDYTGIFWITCLLYSLIFYYVYKISIIFLKQEKLALLATAMMSLSFFCPLIHNDIRAEDFCQLFIVLSMYWCCKVLYQDNTDSKNTIYMAAFWIGLSIAACLMIKFTIAAMVFFLWFYLVAIIIKKYNLVTRMAGSAILGASVILVPFAIYFAVTGSMQDFIYEYFIRTFVTVGKTNESLSYASRLWSYFISPVSFLVFLISLSSTLYFVFTTTKHRLFPVLSFIVFYFITLQNGIWHHYYIVCAVFPLFGIVAVLQKKRLQCRLAKYTRLIVFIVLLLCSIVNVIRFSLTTENFFLCETNRRAQYYEYSSFMHEKDSPKIVVLGMELGYGTSVNAIPGCKFWARQTGATKEMDECQWNSIKNKVVDFVFVANNDADALNQMNETGYFPYFVKGAPFTLYSKEEIKHKKQVKVAWNDVLLKKNLYGR